MILSRTKLDSEYTPLKDWHGAKIGQVEKGDTKSKIIHQTEKHIRS